MDSLLRITVLPNKTFRGVLHFHEQDYDASSSLALYAVEQGIAKWHPASIQTLEQMEAQASATGYEWKGKGARQISVKYRGERPGPLSGPPRPIFEYTIGAKSKAATRDEVIVHMAQK